LISCIFSARVPSLGNWHSAVFLFVIVSLLSQDSAAPVSPGRCLSGLLRGRPTGHAVD
jgi:hypothetical protein